MLRLNYEKENAWCCVCGRAQGELRCLIYSTVVFCCKYCWVLILSLFYLLFIFWCVSTRGWCIGKQGIFHMNQTYICLDTHQRIRVWLAPSNMFSPPVIFLLTVPRWFFLLFGPFCYFCFVLVVCHIVLSVPCSLVVICWERADPLTLLYVIFSCVLSLSHMMCWPG